MALDFEIITIPVAYGLEQSVDDRVRPMDRPQELTNVTFDKAGLLKKRNGFTSFGTTVATGASMVGYTGGSVRGIFSSGDELCVIGQRRLFAYNNTHKEWYDRGPISPCVGALDNDFKSQWSYQCPDMAKSGNWILTAAQASRLRVDQPANLEWAIATQIRSVDGDLALQETLIGQTATYTDRFHSPRCASCTGKLLLFVMQGAHTDASQDLQVYEAPTATPEIEPQYATTFTTNIRQASGDQVAQNIRTYDAIGLSTGDYLVAWVDDTNGELIVRRYNSSHVQQDTITITDLDPYTRVALAEGAGDQVYILASSEALTEDRVVLYSRKRTDLSTSDFSADPVTLSILNTSPSEVATNLGVVEGKLNGTARVVATWYVTTSSFGVDSSKMQVRSCNISGGSLTSLREAWNAVPLSRPMYNLNRFYSRVAFEFIEAEGATYSSAPFSSSCLVDLHIFEGADEPWNPVVAAIYDFGLSPNVGYHVHDVGSANNVVSILKSADVYEHRMMSSSYTYWSTVTEPQYASDRLKFDFSDRPMAASVMKTCSLIGGGYVSCYSGGEVNELGFLFSPIAHGDSTLVSGGSLTDATAYAFIGVYEDWNSISGLLHRSAPGMPATWTTATPNLSVDLKYFSMPFSARKYDRVGCITYRAGPGGAFQRANKPQQPQPNVIDNEVLDAFNDGGTFTGPAIYTISGDIEAATPEGARIPSVGIGRVWLGDMMRRDRIQFSDPYSPDTAASNAFAPEFNEGFSRITPDGAKIMGQAEMDDKMVIFTADSVYMLFGDGPSNAGVGDFSQLTLITGDSGCVTPFSVCKFAEGIMFKGRAGIYMLNRSLEIDFVGYSVIDETNAYPVITSATLVESKNQVRFTCLNSSGTQGIILVYDYILKTWVKWIVKNSSSVIQPFIDSCVHNDVYYAITSTGVIFYEDNSTCYDDVTNYPQMIFRCGWVQKAGQGAWQRVSKIVPLLKKEDDHGLTIQLYKDFETTPCETKSFTSAQIDAFDNELVREQALVSVQYQQSQAYSIRLSDFASGTPSDAKGFSLSGIQFEVGTIRGVVRTPEAQRI